MQGPKGALWNASLIAVDGRVAGGWRRQVTVRAAQIAPILPSALSADEEAALARAAEAYGEFLQVPAVVA
jgi:hypothetical protein